MGDFSEGNMYLYRIGRDSDVEVFASGDLEVIKVMVQKCGD